ncbi:hypothetical protein IG631_02013 [Alternaria alternata]|nr:hypothetical protein IG631_02013 [Alternaria alternata]
MSGGRKAEKAAAVNKAAGWLQSPNTLRACKRKTGTLHCRSRTSNRRNFCHTKASAAH